MTVPDLLGQEWESAHKTLSLSSCSYKKILTTPPWPGLGQGKLRVVRQKYISEEQIEIIVCYDIYLKN